MNAMRIKTEIQGIAPSAREGFLDSLVCVLGVDRATSKAKLEWFTTTDFAAARTEVNARGAGDGIAVSDTGTITEKFAGISMEDTAIATREITNALRAYRAETGDIRQLPSQLGYTVHAGEQLRGIEPFELLKQVDEAIGLGADRIGHGLIIAIDPQQLVRMGQLRPEQIPEFTAQQQLVRDHVKAAGVTIEMNVTSNTQISNYRRDRRRSRQRPRRAKGDKSKNAKVAFAGAIYTLRRAPDGRCEGPIHKRIFATFESHAALFKWLHHEAVKRGYGTKRTLFLADGAEAIWDQQAIWFPKAEPGIDWVHIVEKVWAAGRCLNREGSPQLAAWVAARVRDLGRPSGADKVITTLSAAYASIAKTGPGNKAKREKLLNVLTHFSKHRHRMCYHALRRDDLDIATGVIEGVIRNLVRMRLDGPGMRWSRGRSEWVLHLRCILLNGQWDQFAAHLARRGSLQLAATPTPTRSHDAVKKAA
jgi:hypothetical protein